MPTSRDEDGSRKLPVEADCVPQSPVGPDARVMLAESPKAGDPYGRWRRWGWGGERRGGEGRGRWDGVRGGGVGRCKWGENRLLAT